MEHSIFPLGWKDEYHSTSKEEKEKVYPHDSGRDAFLCHEGGGIKMISPFSFLTTHDPDGDAGRRKDGACFGF
ncbi:MAG TPA: hypothetical protein VLK23_16565 [Thermodesulfobacteriota bacterium]|nr:hypothetical protein [Thermodesulfobacteriota bacterium]